MSRRSSGTYSLQSLENPQSITSETKEKFEAIFLATKKKSHNKNHESQECLINPEKETKFQYENDGFSGDNEAENKKYILDKFLGGARKKNVEKKVDKYEECSDASPSMNTYTKNSPKLNSQEHGSESDDEGNVDSEGNKTYNIEEVGDILLHNSSSKAKITSKKQRSVATISDGEDAITNNDDAKTAPKPLPRKKKAIKQSEDEPIIKPKPRKHQRKEDSKETSETEKNSKAFSYKKIVQIIVHKTDRLQLNPLLIHPVVRVHIVDMSTGKYLAKSDPHRPTVFFYEDKNVDYISPVLTQIFNLQEKRSLFPSWEETILINEDFDYILNEDNKIILFFEIQDFLSFSTAQKFHPQESSKGWLNIAFAFLKLSGPDKSLNLNKRLRLQLYKPQMRTKPEEPHICPVWSCWRKRKLEKYPSILYVTIKSVISPKTVVQCLRSKTPVEREMEGDINLENSEIVRQPPQNKSTLINNKETHENDSHSWSRQAHEVCRIPNKLSGQFPSYEEGCFVMKFSNNGLFLACAVKCEEIYCLAVFSIISMEEIGKFPCHQGIIYSISWSRDDSFLYSASADKTISIFDFKNADFVQILAHPAFVYSCDVSLDDSFIASGCFDKVVRVWNKCRNQRENMEFELAQELANRHSGYVTCVQFDSGNRIFSSDSMGVIVVWKQESTKNWEFEMEISPTNLKQICINQILLFSKERKIFAHCRDGIGRILDIKSGCILWHINNSFKKKISTFATISPCGSYILIPGSDGTVQVWYSKKTNKLLTVLNPYETKNLMVHCVQFHPFDNILAISHYGHTQKILIFTFDKTLETDEAVSSTLGSTSKPRMVKDEKDLDKAEKIDFRHVLKKMDQILTIANLHNTRKH